jgi:hypothetical protein
MNSISKRGLTFAAVVTAMALTAGGTSVAVGEITSKNIKDGTIKIKDIKPGTVAALRGSRGPAGPAGPQGPAGTGGAAQGATPFPGANWSIVHRNVIGAADADLGAGPLDAPYGDGALQLRTASPNDKTAFGNEQDFVGDLVSGLVNIEYSVFTTGENIDKSPVGGTFGNMPSVAFEIDPNLSTTSTNYSTLVFVAANTAPNAWTRINAITAPGAHWALTGAAGTATGCSTAGAYCTWAAIQTALDDGGTAATILTAQVTKGRDYAFSGAVDGLRINNELFNFEPGGVTTTTP